MFRQGTQMIPQQQYAFDPLYDSLAYSPRYMPQNRPQQPSKPMLRGKWINAPEEAMPRDIPDDGSVAVFPMADFSQIIAKAWRSDGTIEEVRYIPVDQKKPEQQDANQMILGQLAQHGQALEQIMEMLTQKKPVRKEQTP